MWTSFSDCFNFQKYGEAPPEFNRPPMHFILNSSRTPAFIKLTRMLRARHARHVCYVPVQTRASEDLAP